MKYRLEVFGMEPTGYHQRGHDRLCFARADYNVWLQLMSDGVCTGIKLIDVVNGITIREDNRCPIE